MNVKAVYVGSKQHPQVSCVHVREKTPIIKTDAAKVSSSNLDLCQNKGS